MNTEKAQRKFVLIDQWRASGQRRGEPEGGYRNNARAEPGRTLSISDVRVPESVMSRSADVYTAASILQHHPHLHHVLSNQSPLDQVLT